MSTLAKPKSNRHSLLFSYLIVTAFCALFSYIYEEFSHGVFSDYMIFLFLFPLLGGVIPQIILQLLHFHSGSQISKNCYHSGLATLIVGSCLTGVFEIYGTVNSYTKIYWIVGWLLLIFGAFLRIYEEVRQRQKAFH